MSLNKQYHLCNICAKEAPRWHFVIAGDDA